MPLFEDAAHLESYNAYREAIKAEMKKVSASWIPFHFVPAYDFGGTKKDIVLVGVVDKAIVKTLPATRVSGRCRKKGGDLEILPKIGRMDDAKLQKITKIVQKANPAIANVKVAGAEAEEEEAPEPVTPEPVNPPNPDAAPPAEKPSDEDRFLQERVAQRKRELVDISTPGAVAALKKASSFKDFPTMMNALTHAFQVLGGYDHYVAQAAVPPVNDDKAWKSAHAKVEKARVRLNEVRELLDTAKQARDVVEALSQGNALFAAKSGMEEAVDRAWDALSNAVTVATGAPPVPKPSKEDLKKKAEEMRARSQEQALAEGKIDWEFKPEPATLKAMAAAFLESKEFNTFRTDFAAFLNKYDLGSEGKLPVVLWKQLLKNMADTGYLSKNVPKVKENGRDSFILAIKGEDGRLIREAMLDKAIKDLKPFVDHAATYMDKVIATVEAGKPWAFWSGTGALDAAKASGGISLEGTVGSMFGTGLNFPNITVNSTLPLWASLSEMYARKAAENVGKFKFIGFVGPGADRDQSVFNMIEQPTFVGSVGVSSPSIEWFVVDCEWMDGKWAPSGKAPASFPNRGAAIGEIQRRYAAPPPSNTSA